MRKFLLSSLALSAALLFAVDARAQQAAPPAPLPPVGAPITLEQAKKAVAAAEVESRKNNWNMAIAVVDPSGSLVHFIKMDGTQYGSINVALDKATSAALYRRPTTAFEAALKAGNTFVLQLRGSNAVPGGIPIIIDGKVVGGIGTSGATGAQDAQVSEAGLAALK